VMDALLERHAAASAHAAMLVARASELTSVIALHRRGLAQRRSDSAVLRRALSDAGATRASVTVTGSIEGRDVSVSWHRSGRCVGDPELLRRAEMLVAMGERWDSTELGLDGPPRSVEASLDGSSVAAALTLMRACTRIHSVTLPDDP
jgi:hypothetical protein